jgi:hypothetical protein
VAKAKKDPASDDSEAFADPPPSFFYCLEESHPGAPSLQASPISMERIFAFSGDGCPVCPSCQRAVSAVPCQEEVPPQSIIELAGRIG